MSAENSFTFNQQVNINEIQQSPESKRRKAEQIDRIYVCQYKKCQKSYGSYPALYTHIKLKHSNQVRKGNQSKLPAKSLQYIKKISSQKSPLQISTTSSTPQIITNEFAYQKPSIEIKTQKKTLVELYEDLLIDLHQIQTLYESKSQVQQESTHSLEPLESTFEEFPSIEILNQDILNPLKTELLSLKSPQTFARDSASAAGLAHKLAELLTYLGSKITQELYSEFCYFLGFFAKCITLKKIQKLDAAQEDFEQIYQYIHDSIGYCTTFRFKFLKNGKILENKDELTNITKRVILNVIKITFQAYDEKMVPHFILA